MSRSLLFSIVVVPVGYGASHRFVPQSGFWSGDSGCKYIQMEEIVRSGYRTFSVSWSGRELDPDLAFLPIREPFGHLVGGELFLQYSPVFATVSSGFHRAFGFAGLFWLPLLAGLLTLPAVWRLAALVGDSGVTPPAAVLLTAFATPVLFYSFAWWEMTPGVCLATWGMVFGLEWVRTGRRNSIVAAAALCGLAIWFRDELIVFAAALAAATIFFGRRSRRGLATFAATLVAVLIPLALFQWKAVGSPFGHHFGQVAFDAARFLPERATVFENLFMGNHGNRWFSLTAGVLPIALFFAFPRLGVRAFSRAVPVVATVATVVGLWLFSAHLGAANPVTWLIHANGLFAVTPFVWLGFVRQEGASPFRRTLWLGLLLYAVGYVVAAPVANSEGIHWGCRFLLAVYPGFAVLAADTIARWWSSTKARRVVLAVPVVVVVLLSIAFQLHSLRLLQHRQMLSARLNSAVLARPEPVVVTNGWPVPQELYRVFHRKPIFHLRNPEDSAILLERLRAAGHTGAVYVAWPPRSGAPSPARQVIDDPLSFPSFEISGVSLAR
jgi:hypothetical protein